MRTGLLALACLLAWTSPGGTPADRPPTVSAADLGSGRFDGSQVRFVGTVSDCFRDEVDPNWAYVILVADGRTVTVTVKPETDSAWQELNNLIGAEIAVIGRVTRLEYGARRHLGRVVKGYRWSMIEVLRPHQADPYSAPDLSSLTNLPLASVDFSVRHRADGRVIARWRPDSVLVARENGEYVRISFGERPLPACGDRIEALGFPETDLYRYHLCRAIWRKAPDSAQPPEERPEVVEPWRLLQDVRGRPRIETELYGHLIRFQGVVPALTALDRETARMDLVCGAVRLTVDASDCPAALEGLAAGSRVSVTGICVVDAERWTSSAFFPHARGIFVVLRSPADVTVVAAPPWWTVGRLLVVLSVLVVLLLGFLVWNRILNRLVDRRSRALLKEQVARIGESLRVDERTRLAVELHDSVAQNLSGVALQIDAAQRLADVDVDRMKRRLGFASRSLFSCREELRNCLWDLRSDALGAKDMNEAIRLALNPVIGDATAVVRFNVPRAKLSDGTAHALMRIVRELASNAVRHGKARTLKVAGAIEGGRILCSVTDDGTGFDPRGCPGPAEGHFGLQGVRERLRRFAGEMTVESASGRGTRVKVVMS